MIAFEIIGKPIPWKRAGRNGRKSYDSQIKEKDQVRWSYKIASKGISFGSKPLSLYIEYHMTTPAYWSLKKRLKAFFTPHTKKPDIDNLLKLILDALNGVAWNDDAQVWYLSAKKIYSEFPKTIVHITPLEENECKVRLLQC